MADNTIIQQTPSFVGEPQVYFTKGSHDKAIFAHGYWIVAERAVRCPCSSIGNGASSTCQNCGGIGYFYINPIECQALITGINTNTEHKVWSPELIGTASITVENSQREAIEYYNRITLKDEYAVWSETLDVRTVGVDRFVFCTYAPTQLLSAWVYQGDNLPLVKLTDIQCFVSPTNKYILKLSPDVVIYNGSLSVSYQHKLEYHIIDIPHAVRSSRIQEKTGALGSNLLPKQGIGRLAHLIVGSKPNYDGSGVIDNNQ